MSEIAVVGAGGAVGREILRLLEERGRPAPKVFGSVRRRGEVIPYAGAKLRSQVLWDDPLSECRVALFATESSVSQEWAPKFVEKGAVVVDNSSAFRLDPDIPLVVPEINGRSIPSTPGVVANPNCTTILLTLALAPLRALGSFRAIVSTYQAVSGAGHRGLSALERELAGQKSLRNDPFPFPIAKNLFPCIGDVDPESGMTGEEQKVVAESRRILELSDLEVFVTCVRVPVERCHSESVTLIFDRPVDREEAIRRLADAPGLEYVGEDLDMPTPLARSGLEAVAVSRVRRPAPEVLELWIVGDQLLKGAALNAVQIAESVLAGSES